MQNYGLILADNGSNWYFQGTAYPQWPDDLVSLLKQIPASDFEAVNESCLMVSPNSGQARARRAARSADEIIGWCCSPATTPSTCFRCGASATASTTGRSST